MKTKTLEKKSRPDSELSKPHTSMHHTGTGSPVSGIDSIQQVAGNLTIQHFLQSGMIQAKLKIDNPNNPLENESNHVANHIMQKEAKPCHCGGACSGCSAEAESLIQRKPVQSDIPGTSAPDSLLHGLGSGNSLSPSIRAFFEPHFGADFTDVRVHTGIHATDAAHSVQARAFTAGNDIAFNKGEYAPDSQRGRELLAHELTHVVQQGAAGPSGRAPQRYPEVPAASEDAAAESEADDASRAVLEGQAIPSLSTVATSDQTVQRQDSEETIEETKEQFVERVYTKAISRLQQNIEALGQWRSYVMAMEDFQLHAQLLSGTAYEYALRASLSPLGPQNYETWSGTRNPSERDYLGTNKLAWEASYRQRAGSFMSFLASKTQGYYEDPSVAEDFQVLLGDRPSEELPPLRWVEADPRYRHYAGPIERAQTGESGGCQTCHDINLAYQRTAEEYGDPLPRQRPWMDPKEPLPAWAGPQVQGERALFQYMNDLAAPAIERVATNPWMPQIPVPERVEIPAPRTDLCGELPEAEEGEMEPIDPSQWGPNAAIVAQALTRIGTALEPLGPRGYRVLPYATFNTLWHTGPEGMEDMRAQILENIDERLGKYHLLKAEIAAGLVPYDELCPIVDELLPTTNARLRAMVTLEIRMKQAEEAFVNAVLAIAGLAMLLFAIIFPPAVMLSAPMIAAGAGLTLAGLAVGSRDLRRGHQYGLGRGAGIYTPAQEAQAEALVFWGAFNIVLSVIGLYSLARTSRAVAATRLGSELQAGRPPVGMLPGTRISDLGAGRLKFTHPDFPELVSLLDADGLRLINTADGSVAFWPRNTVASAGRSGGVPQPARGILPALPEGSAPRLGPGLQGSPPVGLLPGTRISNMPGGGKMYWHPDFPNEVSLFDVDGLTLYNRVGNNLEEVAFWPRDMVASAGFGGGGPQPGSGVLLALPEGAPTTALTAPAYRPGGTGLIPYSPGGPTAMLPPGPTSTALVPYSPGGTAAILPLGSRTFLPGPSGSTGPLRLPAPSSFVEPAPLVLTPVAPAVQGRRAAGLWRQHAELENALDQLRSHPEADRMLDELDAADYLIRQGDLDSAAILLEGVSGRVRPAQYAATEAAFSSGYGSVAEGRLTEFAPTAPSGAGRPIHLDETAPISGDATGQRLLGHVEDALVRFEIEGFTPGQQRALQLHPEFEPAFRGSRIDEFAKQAIMRDPELEHVIATVNYERGADFYDSVTGQWYDITTTGAWRAHVRKYGPLGFRLPTEPAP